MTKLLGSIYFGRDDIMASAVDHGRVRPHQGHRDSTEKLACWLSFVTTLLSGKSLPKSPHHIRCHTMKAPESFYCQRRKLKPLGSTRFCSISHFPVIGLGQSPARFCCCACHIGWGERAGNSNIYRKWPARWDSLGTLSIRLRLPSYIHKGALQLWGNIRFSD